MKKLALALVFIALIGAIPVMSQSTIMEELHVLDSSAIGFRFDRQSLVCDNNGDYHLFYISPTEAEEYLIARSSSDEGLHWDEADTISVYTPSSSAIRFLALSPSATVDEYGQIHIIYEYRGLPIYHSSYSDYPPSHLNYVYKASNDWVTEVDVINDHAIQSSQGNSATVCYLFKNQVVNFNGTQHYIGYDYAWWATKYNIVHSDNSSGQWTAGSALSTYDLGAIDTRILNAPSLVVNGDSLYAIWYQGHECQIEMKALGEAGEWSDLRLLYSDVYKPVTPVNHYDVGVGSYSNGSDARITMLRVPETDFNELLILSKSLGQTWLTDTLMLSTPYSRVRPTVVGDTTLLFLVNGSGDNYSHLMKYFPGLGTVSKSLLVSNTNDDKFNNIVLSDKTINPISYMVYDELKAMYYLKVGRLADYVGGLENSSKEPQITLSQNYPNPFRYHTNISYSLRDKSRVRLNVFDSMGKLVDCLVDDTQTPGNYSIRLSAKDFVGGVYYYSLSSDEGYVTKRMLILK